MNDTNPVPVYKLSAVDFESHPIWVFNSEVEHEGVDESYASPSTEVLQLGMFGSFMVYATYHLRNGRSLPGAVQVDLQGAKVLFTPVVMYVHGKAVDPLSRDVEARLARITKTADNRPTSWSLNVPFTGEASMRSGRIARSSFVQALWLLLRLIMLRFSRKRQ